MPYTDITLLPLPMKRTADEVNFVSKSDAWIASFGAFTTEINAASDYINSQGVLTNAAYDTVVADTTSLLSQQVTDGAQAVSDALDELALATTQKSLSVISASEALSSETTSASTVGFLGEWSDQTGAYSTPTSVTHNNRLWQLAASLADITLSEPSVSSDWVVTGNVFLETGDTILTRNPTDKPLPSYLLCDGSAYNTTTYSLLFAILSSGTLPDIPEIDEAQTFIKTGL